MVKKTLSLLIVGIIVGMLFVSFIPMSVMGMTGSGTAENPYMIYNVTDLQNMNLHLAAYYELANDIDASATSGWNGGVGFLPIAPGHGQYMGFYFPTADYGSNGTWTVYPSSPTTRWDKVNSYDQGTSYIMPVNSTSYVLFDINSLNISMQAVNIDVVIDCEAIDSGVSSYHPYIRVDSGNYKIDSFAEDPSSSYWDFQQWHVTTNPATGLSWDFNPADVNSIEAIGVYIISTSSLKIGAVRMWVDYDLTFSGSFDGKGHTISNLYINSANGNGLNGPVTGLLGNVEYATVKNVGLISPYINGVCSSGALAGDIENSDVSNCYVQNGTVSVTTTYSEYVGGLVGYAESCNITDCYSSCNIIGDSDIGGLTGGAWYTSFSNCGATGNINDGYSDYIYNRETGGFIGYDGSNTYEDCYATGNVWGNYEVGGFIGNSYGGSNYTRCFATGDVYGEDYVGGFVGETDGDINHPVYFNQCFATGNVYWSSDSSGWAIGGFAGELYQDYNFASNCYARGDVDGGNVTDAIGGFVGDIYYGYADNCYSTGLVLNESSEGGGFTGENWPAGYATDCFWDIQTSGRANGSGDGEESGLTGANTTEMKTKSTFTGAGWAFYPEVEDPVWNIADNCNDGYPYICEFCYLEWMCIGGCGPAWPPEGDYDDATPLNGCVVEDNNSTWVITVPYFNYYKEWVDGSIEVWYQPTTMINSPLLDMSGNVKDGVINWGMSIGDIDVGGILPFSAFTPTGTETVPTVIPGAGDIPTDETSGATGEGLPLYYSFKKAADSLGWSLPVTYTLMFIIVAIVVGVAGLVAMGTGWGFSIGFGATMVLFGQVRDGGGIVIVPGFILIFTILVAIFLGYIWRYT